MSDTVCRFCGNDATSHHGWRFWRLMLLKCPPPREISDEDRGLVWKP